MALASLKSGNKKVAVRHAREMKLASVSGEKCVSLLNRVEQILDVIANAESTKKVTFLNYQIKSRFSLTLSIRSPGI